MEGLSQFIVRFRLPIILGFIATTAFFASRIPQVQVESQVKAMLPTDMPARINLDKIEELFGGTDMVMLAMSSDDILKPDYFPED